MEETFGKVEQLIAHIKEYVDNRVASVKLSIAEKVSKLVAGLLAIIIVVFFFIFFMIFASIALACVLSSWIGHWYAGFLIVAGLYLILGIVIWSAKGKLLRLPIMNAMIKNMFDDTDA